MADLNWIVSHYGDPIGSFVSKDLALSFISGVIQGDGTELSIRYNAPTKATATRAATAPTPTVSVPVPAQAAKAPSQAPTAS